MAEPQIVRKDQYVYMNILYGYIVIFQLPITFH